MTIDWYRDNGYAIAASYEQEHISRAETDVFRAYILPILPNAKITDANIEKQLADIAICLLAQRSIKLTRKGAKVKTDANSQSQNDTQVLTEYRTIATLAINELRLMQGANKTARVTDICRLSFRSIYWTL